jgi:cytochrome c oxidase cbb3-type subunit III
MRMTRTLLREHALASVGAAAVLLVLTACGQEPQVSAAGAPAIGLARTSNGIAGVSPGIHPSVVYGTLSNPYTGNAAAAAQGRQLFVWYNCSGCHGGRAGGGMGPTLRDSSSRKYGNSDTQLFATIVEGRPAGMPAWGGKLTDDQIWKLIAYIRTLDTPQEPDRVSVPPPGT